MPNAITGRQCHACRAVARLVTDDAHYERRLERLVSAVDQSYRREDQVAAGDFQRQFRLDVKRLDRFDGRCARAERAAGVEGVGKHTEARDRVA